ncbi:MAG: phosphoribosyltransferase [Polyangia bacterium]|jgi:hypoxanthine phosphoribosyltransferase|nr:phosphoribosyltransferase [Polyangia bacterium]
MVKIAHIDPDQFLLDTMALGRKVYETGFRPKHAISIWRGGTPVGLGVDAYFRGQGVYMNHTTVATESYKGIGRQEGVILKGLEHVVKVICREDELLILDDVYESGRTIGQIVETLRERARRNAPEKIMVATVHSKPERHVYKGLPVVCLREVASDTWIDYPHELADLYDPADHGAARIQEKDPKIWQILNEDPSPEEDRGSEGPFIYLTARDLLYDSLRLGVKIARDESFYPDFLIAMWPGGVSAGLPVHEVIKYLNRLNHADRPSPDHISINTTRTHLSYRSNVIGVQYLAENICDHHNILIIDTIFRSGRMVNDVILKLKAELRRNLSLDRIKVASVYYNPEDRSTWTVPPIVRAPDYYLRRVPKDVIYPQSYYRLPDPHRDLHRYHPELAALLFGQ